MPRPQARSTTDAKEPRLRRLARRELTEKRSGGDSLNMSMTIAAAASQSAPWWFASTMALAGVAVGALLKSVLDLFLEKNKRRREDALRWAPERSAAYARCLAALGDMVQAIRRKELAMRLNPSDRSNVELAFEEANQQVVRSLAEVEIVGPDDVAQAADSALKALFIAYQRPAPIDLGSYNQARDLLVQSARRALPNFGQGDRKQDAPGSQVG